MSMHGYWVRNPISGGSIPLSPRLRRLWVLLGANLDRTIVTNGDFMRTCETVPQPSELRFGVVHAVSRGTAVLDGGPRPARGRGGLWGFSTPFSQWEMPLHRRRWNVSDSCAKTSQHFRSANVSLESSIHGLVGDVFGFNINVGVYEKLAKQNAFSATIRMLAAAVAARAAIISCYRGRRPTDSCIP